MDHREVGTYFKKRKKVKELMEKMLEPKFKWTRDVKAKFEKAWNEFCQAYNEHEELCK